MAQVKKLFLIDAYALIYSAYYAFIKNPRINSKGFDTSAIMGFLNSIFDIIKRENPDYFSAVFDKGGSTDRIEIFEDYKANRDSTPAPILDSVPIIHEILNALGIKTLQLSGYEADDIIGTVAKQAEKDPSIEVFGQVDQGSGIVALDTSKPPLDDLRVRKALAYAVDRKVEVQAALGGVGGILATDWVCPKAKWYCGGKTNYPEYKYLFAR